MLWLVVLVTMLAQMQIQPGRKTTNHNSYQVNILQTVTCTGVSCTITGTVTTLSSGLPFAGQLAIYTTRDASLSVGGSSGTGAGFTEVSCDGGGSWMMLATASGSVGGGVPIPSYAAPNCPTPANTNLMQFRSRIAGPPPPGFNENWTSPSTAYIVWY